MTPGDLSYQQAEAILQQLAGQSSWQRPETAPPASSLTEAKGVAAARRVAPRLDRVSAQHPNWSESTFRSLVDSAPEALLIFDSEGIIILVNAQAEKLFGYRREDLLARSIEEFVPDLFHRSEAASWRADVPLELYGHRKDGRDFPVEVSLSPLASEQGNLITGTIRDISSRKRLEARYRNLVEGIPAVTFMAALDEGLNELYVSPQIEQLLGFSQKEWLEDPVLWYTRLHPQDRDRWHLEFAQTCATAAPFRSVYRFIARDGRIVW